MAYGDPTSEPALRLDFETDDAIGRVTLWESGECDMEVSDTRRGADLLSEHHEFKTTDVFFAAYPKVPLLLRKIRGDILSPGEYTQEANRVPVTDYESQPRVPHHPAYGSVQGGSNQTRAFGAQR